MTAALCETAGMLTPEEDEKDRDPVGPMVTAFLLEAAMQYLVSVGHNLANIGLRLCVESEDCRARLEAGNSSVRKILAAVLGGENHPSSWIYHSQASQIVAQLGGLNVAPAECLDVVGRLHDATDWREMTTARNMYFHRWREGFRGGTTSANQAVLELQTYRPRRGMCRPRNT